MSCAISYRFPGNVLCFDKMLHRRAKTNLGIVTFLRSLDLRASRWQQRSTLWTRWGLRSTSRGQPQVQTLGQDQQDRQLPRLLPSLRVWGWREIEVPWHSYSPTTRRTWWLPSTTSQARITKSLKISSSIPPTIIPPWR